MVVTDIEITNYRYCPRSARHVANVCVTLKDRVVDLLCTIDMPGEEARVTRNAALVTEALRQLRRLPEVRSGREDLSFPT